MDGIDMHRVPHWETSIFDQCRSSPAPHHMLHPANPVGEFHSSSACQTCLKSTFLVANRFPEDAGINCSCADLRISRSIFVSSYALAFVRT